ncbi:hypothetical protein [Paraflavitalea sp. CAU 1676]|uniref:hypothetical protein n=1 Tax=Paraflavitalea sp. CAU 1676 TaxID=3032598 RepID=UPI0023DC7D28|nr:hypothetical protein [Paraflavitalea sp. CAU 1676]MDF2188998.1 hypothetical protein [Paraflavitalea sp. CAU 1676]
MRFAHFLPSLACFTILVIVSCNPARKSGHAIGKGRDAKGTAAATAQPASACGEKVKFYGEKVLSVKTGKLMDIQTEITLDPAAKLLTFSGQEPGEEKVTFDTDLETIECHFNGDFTVGWALYSGNIKQKDGRLTKSIVKLEAKDGMLQFSNGDTEKESELVINVAKWEIIEPGK